MGCRAAARQTCWQPRRRGSGMNASPAIWAAGVDCRTTPRASAIPKESTVCRVPGVRQAQARISLPKSTGGGNSAAQARHC